MAKIKNHNPRKGTETSMRQLFLVYENWIQLKNHNPRKGTETRILLNFSANALGSIKNHNPRKGTETRTSYIYIFHYNIKNHNPRKGTETPCVLRTRPLEFANN